ncbi:hypothetical protein JCM19237_2846 [Photobacterium aphoticum]|uniref:Uncharacterized protein n=1 Tax=Photobacterium aphoticum TaxID=754436 RepID=A0A090RLB2_9GAMM|nr:hypothetical protein JCM19237_2846 [Photobacterium aphoticum]
MANALKTAPSHFMTATKYHDFVFLSQRMTNIFSKTRLSHFEIAIVTENIPAIVNGVGMVPGKIG